MKIASGAWHSRAASVIQCSFGSYLLDATSGARHCSGFLNAAVSKADEIFILRQTRNKHVREKKISKIISADYMS